MLAAMPPSPSIPPQGVEPPIRDRGDACPGALRLHPAADGRLARVRLPSGDLTARQATALADAAERLGDGHLSLTSRGNAELRGLPDGCGQELAGALRAAGLLPAERHERIRNILTSPLAGLDHHAPADVRLWARQLDAALCASAWTPALSGRFLFVLDDGRGDVAALGGDVTLVAESDTAGDPRGAVAGAACGGALLYVGDDPAALRIAGRDVPRAALTAAAAFLAAAEAGGTGAWRVRELPATHALTVHDTAARLRAAGIEAEHVTDHGDGAGPAGPGLAAHAGTPVPVPLPGIVEGPDGRRALSVLAPLGRLTVAQWRLLTAVAATDGTGELRTTPWRGVLVPGLSDATAAPRLRELAAAGLITAPDSPWHRIGACTGRPGCAKSRADVRADAAAAIGTTAAGPGLPVHWSGCERRCGHPHGTWVDVLATGEGYRVSVAGTEAATSAPVPVPVLQVPTAIAATAAAAGTP
ncbi:precorrin-3B synthase [Streptomyces sp. SID7805]|nr:precorrin-3B synthase [Streptomyces sp. SID7805]